MWPENDPNARYLDMILLRVRVTVPPYRSTDSFYVVMTRLRETDLVSAQGISCLWKLLPTYQRRELSRSGYRYFSEYRWVSNNDLLGRKFSGLLVALDIDVPLVEIYISIIFRIQKLLEWALAAAYLIHPRQDRFYTKTRLIMITSIDSKKSQIPWIKLSYLLSLKTRTYQSYDVYLISHLT